MSKSLLWEKLQSHCSSYSLQASVSGEPSRIKATVSTDRLFSLLSIVKEYNAFLLTIAASDERSINNSFGLYAVFAFVPEKTIMEIGISVEAESSSYSSITPLFPSAHWLEREIKDMFGIIPQGHPDLRRLAVHPDWPAEVYPLRKDFQPGDEVPRVSGEIEFLPVEGEGIYQVPVGPIHAGIIEPGHFRFYAFGEDVINLQAQLFYTHRGVEKVAEGRHYEEVSLIAERVCGVCSCSHSVAYAQAIESLAGIDISSRAKYIRTILLEMERLYNHIGDIGNMCAGIGFAFGISRGAILKEEVMRKNGELTGHRYLRGTVIPGGVNIDLPLNDFIPWLERIERDLKELTNVILSSQGLLERMMTTGILPLEAAVTLGAVGPAARASGVGRDLRKELPYAAYGEFDFKIPLQKKGDVFCRLVQRIEESVETFRILRQAVSKIPHGELIRKLPDLRPYQTSVGYTESARGADIHWVMTGENNTIYRYSIRSASHCNWPVLPLCVPGNIIPDFPLINKSFELCYACLDR